MFVSYWLVAYIFLFSNKFYLFAVEQHLQRRRHLALINYQNFVALNELDVNNSCNNR